MKQHLNLTIDHDLVEFWDKNRRAYASRSGWLNDLLAEWKRTGHEPGAYALAKTPAVPRSAFRNPRDLEG
jgi:hypothetical protein